MKKTLITGLFVTLFSLTSYLASAQDTNPVPKWVSEKGYWVVEGNLNTPLDNTIRFYNNDDALVYQETLKGVKLKAGKRKVQMKLKRILESAIIAWENNQQQTQGLALVKESL